MIGAKLTSESSLTLVPTESLRGIRDTYADFHKKDILVWTASLVGSLVIEPYVRSRKDNHVHVDILAFVPFNTDTYSKFYFYGSDG